MGRVKGKERIGRKRKGERQTGRMVDEREIKEKEERKERKERKKGRKRNKIL
jgi:hypothetical protein